jgi:hypothetical protein
LIISKNKTEVPGTKVSKVLILQERQKMTISERVKNINPSQTLAITTQALKRNGKVKK